MSDKDDKVTFVGEPMTVSDFGKLMQRANEIKAEGKDPHKVLGGEALRHKAERVITTQQKSKPGIGLDVKIERDRNIYKSPIDRAQTTLAHLAGNSGRLTEKQSSKFCEYLSEAIEEERARWFAATWYQRLWYRIKLVYWRVTFQSSYPFGVKVFKFKERK